MAHILIFTTPLCPYCHRAVSLLKAKGVIFEQIDLWQEGDRRQEMIEASGGRSSVPQIFIDGKPIGGSDELLALEENGTLDPLLGL